MSIKLLLADDSITIQKVIGIIFGGEDYDLTVVDNGKAALDKAREILPDVLLIDALMPGMSGYEVCEQVRATPQLATKPVLLLTGSFEPFDEAKAASCGADDFIAKPFESQQIVTKVKELFELGASRAAKAEPAVAAPQSAPPLAAPAMAAAVIAEPESAPPAPPNDIWGAFTFADEAAPAPAVQQSPSNSRAEPDVFAMVNEETGTEAAPPEPSQATSLDAIGSRWIPTEEHTFEFEEETVAEVPANVFSQPAQPAMEREFGEVSFADLDQPVAPPDLAGMETAASQPAQPSFSGAPGPGYEEAAFTSTEPGAAVFVAPAAAAFSEPAAPVLAGTASIPAAAPSPLVPPLQGAVTEDQLRAVIAGASKEIIERVVWEVVPDLAEILINEAIRKIKEGR